MDSTSIEFEMIGESAEYKKVISDVRKVAKNSSITTLITGESGTGKEVLARFIHKLTNSTNQPFIDINCGAIPDTLLESELFGYEKGAFTGANQDKKGLFDEANGGTLFLDEITNIPQELQSKFLRTIQEGEIRPVGSTKVRKINVRIVAAASNDLRAQVKTGNFREDLFYRLNVVNIKLPPLRERKEDIPILAQHFFNQFSEKYSKQIKGFQPESITALESYSWPGNVRELENVVERTFLLAQPQLETVPPELLPPEILTKDVEGALKISSEAQSIKAKKASYEKNILLEALEKHGWNQSAAAKELGIHESTLRYKMQKFRLKKP